MARKPVAKDPTTDAAKSEVTPQNTVVVTEGDTDTATKSIEKIGSITRLTF